MPERIAYIGIITYLSTLLVLGHHGLDTFTASVVVTMTQDLLPGSVGFASGMTLEFSMDGGDIGTAAIGWAADVMGSLSTALYLLLIPTF